MKKKLAMIIFLTILICTASLYAFYTREAVTTENAKKNEDMILINKVVELEKGLVLTQLRSISLDDFKSKVSPLIHSFYRASYLEELEKNYNENGSIAVSTEIPLMQYISKVYFITDGVYKYIFVKIPEKDVIGQVAKQYTFKQENGEWNIFSIKHYVLSNDMKEPKKDVERFTEFYGIPIEYEQIKIIEK